MKEQYKRSYRADKTPDGNWTVFRVTTRFYGPWYWRVSEEKETRLGSCIDEKGIQGLINRDVIQLEPEKILATNRYDSVGRCTDYHGW